MSVSWKCARDIQGEGGGGGELITRWFEWTAKLLKFDRATDQFPLPWRPSYPQLARRMMASSKRIRNERVPPRTRYTTPRWTRDPWSPLARDSSNFNKLYTFLLGKNLSLRSNEISYCTQMVLSKIRSGSIKRRRRKREERIVSKRIFGVQQATAKSRFNVIAWPCATVVSASRQPWTMRSLEGKVEVLLSGFFNQRKGWFVDIVERIA